MKNWFPLAVIAATVLYGYAVWLQSNQQQQSSQAISGSAQFQYDGKNPYATPAPAPQAAKPIPKFGAYPCTGNCSDDKAGYRWAEQNGITDPDSCTGDTGAFIDGCRVYARQRAAGSMNK